MKPNSDNPKQDISMEIMLLKILKKKGVVNRLTYEKVLKLYQKKLKEVV